MRSVTYGDPVGLSGHIPSQRAGERVIIAALRFGEQKYSRIGSVRTRAGGQWSFSTKPRIDTRYRATWRGSISPLIRVLVQPRVEIDVIAGVLTTKVVAARSFAGRSLVLQRRSGGRWRSYRRLTLDERSTARHRLSVPRGVSTLRLFLSDRESGPGYGLAYSQVLTYTRS